MSTLPLEPVSLRARKLALRDAELKAADPNYEFSDVANARLLLDFHGHKLRYCPDWDTWLVWDETRFARDAAGEVGRLAKRTLDEALLDAAQETDPKRRERRTHGITACMRDHRIRAMIAQAQNEEGAVVRAVELDADPWALNVINGTIDLKTGELREHKQSDLITKLAPVEYDVAAECPRFRASLVKVFDSNEKLISFTQRGLGYALTGSVREQVFFIFYGVGANGKTTLILIVLDVLGDYATSAAPEVLLARRGDEHPTAIADLEGARLVAAVEVDEGRRLAESLVKSLTGGDRIKSRRMRQDYRKIELAAKFILACNHRPVIRGTDYAIWRRIRLVPFNVVIPPSEQDKDLLERLRAERPGILRWLVEGCIGWQIHGLGEPEEVTRATDSYRSDMDVLAAFLETECHVGGGYSVGKGAFGKAYREWCERNGDKPLGRAEFRLRLLERGIDEGRDREARFWKGVGLLEDLKSTANCDGDTP